ncbi:MAG: helix-turn-helix domain-containing protein [Verrucomicrobia bacterium]|nr:helix-turn-helix domain-containing protein [Verrucomicrobiota bacterium]
MDTPDFFVGARLGAARIKAGISLEQAAKDTRIRVQRLREIEADDFSGFTHPTYSRLFLLDYAEYLGISPDEIRPLLPDRAGAAGGGFQYINALSRGPSSPVVPMRTKKRPSLLRVFIVAGIILVLVVAAFFVYLTVKKIERVTGSSPLSDKSSAEQSAVPPAPSPALAATPEPTPEPVPVENSLPGAAGTPAESSIGGSKGPSTPPAH